jgi:hypothetical protein
VVEGFTADDDDRSLQRFRRNEKAMHHGRR